MSNFDKQSRIGTILHDKDLYMKNNKKSPNYISVDEYNSQMMRKKYNNAQIKKEHEANKKNIFQILFYIPIRIYNSTIYTHSKISSI